MDLIVDVDTLGIDELKAVTKATIDIYNHQTKLIAEMIRLIEELKKQTRRD